ncbi:gluconate 2-dehydrogenase subunit 3 family protein [Aquiflexum sp. LQ15W]|uniref:gluconate 2-dehydrogenase subunit 3 family protein n=1 Tax=Cognataquiflexum nitidum TaxID=2922272 RepID=UPI001F135D9F|nr:gluconate 2-dehydrogenase subunit 3 family protein [Cognataquiflexum nitidum]MCH6201795.1 gluconate 2-dehydrogenase subunit 3 family protein [Cognataquiflexum nitidum]
MKRRDALRSLALITGGLVLVPSCDFSKEDILSAYQNLQITPSLQQLLKEIAGTIIPGGDIKSAAEIEVQDFILVMVNDCIDAGGHKSFMQGLQGFEDFSKKSGGSAFSKLDQAGRKAVVKAALEVEVATDAKPEDPQKATKEFIAMAKRFTIQGFMMSEYIQTQVKPYSLIPGDYQGAVLISDLKHERING